MFAVASSLVKNEAKVDTVNNNVKSWGFYNLQTAMPLSCYECNGQTKIKLEDIKQNK